MLEGAIQLKSGVITSYRTVPSAACFCHVQVFQHFGGRWCWLPTVHSGKTADEALQMAEGYGGATVLTRHESGKRPLFEVIPA